jgi:antitoxin CptB
MAEAHGDTDREARALLWRCRRGMKELDVLLERYAAAVLPRAGARERRALARLLDRPDPELAAYFLAGEVPGEAEMAQLVMRITAVRDASDPLGNPPETVHDRA